MDAVKAGAQALIESQTAEPDDSPETFLFRIVDNLRDSALYESPLEIAKNDTKWDEWQDSANVEGPMLLSDDLTSAADQVRNELEALKQRVRYPRILRNLEVPAEDPRCPDDVFFVRSIKEWSNSVEENAWDDSIGVSVLKLFGSWLDTRLALNEGECEQARRVVADQLVKAVFKWRPADRQTYMVRTEQEVKVPVKPDSKIQLMKAKTDILVSKRFPRALQSRIVYNVGKAVRLIQGMQCIANREPSETGRQTVFLGMSFGEWKADYGAEIGCRQGAFYALSVQSQRRALSLKDRVVYGLVLAGSSLHLVATFWHGDVLRVRYSNDDLAWDIREPSKLVECFYFLCALQEHLDNTFTEDVEAFLARSDKEFLDSEALETRVRNWATSTKSRHSSKKARQTGNREDGPEQPKESEEHSQKKRAAVEKEANERPLKKHHDDDKDEDGPSRKSQSDQSKDKDDADNGGGDGNDNVDNHGGGDNKGGPVHSGENEYGATEHIDERAQNDESDTSVASVRHEPPQKGSIVRKDLSIASWSRGEVSWLDRL